MTSVDEQSDAPAPADDTPTRSRLRSWTRHPLVAALLLFVVTCVLVSPVIALQIHRHKPISVYDELSYFDSVYKAQQGHYIIGQGEHLSPHTGQVVACRGIRKAVPINGRICASSDPPASKLFNTADIDPPTYTFLTTTGARVILKLGITKDLLVAARLMNIAWAGLGLTLLMLFCRRLGVGWPPTILAAALLFFHPLAQTQWVYITPHSLEVAVAVAVAWVAWNWSEGGSRWWAVALAGFVPAWIKATDILSVAAGVLLLLTVALLHYRTHRSVTDIRRLLIGAGLLVGGLAVGSLSFLVLRDHYSLIAGTAPSQFHIDHFSWHLLANTFGSFLQPSFPVISLPGLGVVIILLIFGAAGVSMLNSALPAPVRGLGTAVIGVGMFGPWLFVISNYLVLSQYVSLPGRYGLTIFPLAIACLAVAVRGRAAQIALGVLVVILIHLALFPAAWGILNAVP